jgi:alternate signal-mediated exported protein
MTPRARAARAARMLPVAAGLATALLVGAGTHALWSAQDSFAGGVVTAGDLRQELGAGPWAQIPPGVREPASGPLAEAPSDLMTMPGDVVRLVQPVTTRLTGDNLRAGFSVRFLGAAGSDRHASWFHVEDADGRQVAPATGVAPGGTLLEVPGLSGSGDGAGQEWRVVVRIDVIGSYVWSPTERPTVSGGLVPGLLSLRLEQVRDGAGLDAGGGAP